MSTLSRQARSAERGRLNFLTITMVFAVGVTILWALALALGALWVIVNVLTWLVTL